MTIRCMISTTAHDTMKVTTESSSSKSLTPQRKHRKLLKSGEGEVWSEDVEQVFVEGLHQYWESPWATYSRGRSRWRNQFLVDYLAKAGIERSKKQVASHVQVLRNMWKGEKEYHLVAGGEELFLETGLLAPVKQEASDISVLSPAETDDSYLASPLSPSTTGFSPPFKFDEYSGLLQIPSDSSQPASPVGSGDSPVGTSDVPVNNFSHARGRSASLPGLHRRYSAAISSPLAPRPASSSFEMHNSQGSSSSSAFPRGSLFFNTEGQAPLSTSVSGPPKGYEFGPATTGQNPLYHHSPLLSPGVPWPPPPLAANRLISIHLFAEGMPPFAIPVGALTSDYHSTAQAPPRLLIRIKLRLPSIDDIHGSPTLHGIHGTISFTRPWVTSATCVTDVYAANVHNSHDLAPLQPPTLDPSTSEPTTELPESELTRCRWLDSGKQTSIYQRIIMDNDTMAVIVYDLDRSISDDSPFAEVVGFQKYRVNSEKTTYGPSTVSSSPPYSDYSQAHCPIRSRHATQTSLACALIPVGSSPPAEPRSPPAYTLRPSL